MVLPDIQVNWTAHSLIRKDKRQFELSIPVIQLAAFLAETSRERVRKTGRGPRGRYSQYSTRNKVIKRWLGKAWSNKHFEESGQLWKGLRVRLGAPNRARASFVGKRDPRAVLSKRLLVRDGEVVLDQHGKPIEIKRHSGSGFTSNAKLSKFLMQKERLDLLVPTDAELAQHERLAQSLFSAELAEVLNLENVSFRSQQRARSLERRAKMALRTLGRGRGVR